MLNEYRSVYNGPYNQIDRHEGSLNQAYVVVERARPSDGGLGIGARLDLLYGTDFYLAQSKGLESRPDGSLRWNDEYYGLAIPQAYGEVGYDSLSVKIGHFYTPIGYEGVPAVGNFFYSKSYSYMFGGPFVHWGGIATFQPNDGFAVDAGIVNGWDALDNEVDRAAFLGKVRLGRQDGPLWTSFAILTGDELSPVTDDASNRTRYSLLVGINPTCRLGYVFHHWFGVEDDYFGPDTSAQWYGIDQYVFYRLNQNLRCGFRFEWFRDDDGVRVGLNRPSNPNKPPFRGNFYSLSLGLNWSPCCRLMFRPEVRWDWFDGQGLPYDNGNQDNQFLVGMDMIYKF
jgi:hypothetical protein